MQRGEVKNITTWRTWAQQQLGVPHIIRKGATNATDFQKEHGLESLMRLTDWVKQSGTHKKIRTVDSVPFYYEKAVEAGWYKTTEDLDLLIDSALYDESDEMWVRHLLTAKTNEDKEAYKIWEVARVGAFYEV